MKKTSTVTLTDKQLGLIKALETATCFSDVASIIFEDFKPMYFGARPYADAMLDLRDTTFNPNEMYIADTARSVVSYFLANAQTWKGPVAREVKALLKKKLGIK